MERYTNVRVYTVNRNPNLIDPIYDVFVGAVKINSLIPVIQYNPGKQNKLVGYRIEKDTEEYTIICSLEEQFERILKGVNYSGSNL